MSKFVILCLLVILFISPASSWFNDKKDNPSEQWTLFDEGYDISTYRLNITEGTIYMTVLGDYNTRAGGISMVFVPRLT